MTNPPRRVVAGLGPDGRSCVVFDEPIGHRSAAEGLSVTNLFTGAMEPIDNAGPLESGLAAFRPEQLADPAYYMMYVEFAPGMGREDPGLHYTDTADHFFILEGEVVLLLESDEAVMRAGDAGIIRGVVHGWRNDTDGPVRLVTTVLPARSVYG